MNEVRKETEESVEEPQATDLFSASAPPKTSPAEDVPATASEKAAPSEEATGPVPVKAINLPIVQTNWQKFTDHLKRENPMMAALLAMVEIKEVKENVITAIFHNAGGTSKQVVEKPHYMSVITSSLRDYFKTNLKISFEIDLEKKPAPAQKPAPKPEKIDAEKLLEEDKELKSIVERFDGEVVGKKKIED